MRRSSLIFVCLMIFAIILNSPVKANPENDFALFCQVNNGVKTLYICKSDGADLRELASGKDITPFLVRKHLLYYTDRQLFDYDLGTQQSRLLGKFSEDRISVQELSNTASNGPDQVLVIAESAYERNLYVVDFPDGEVRPVQNSYYNSDSSSSSRLQSYSPDEMSLAIIRLASMNFRFELAIQQKNDNKFRTVWTVPRTMTVIPEKPVWAPNSRLMAFYAKKTNNSEAFYTLYLFDLEKQELQTLQEQVFSSITVGSLRMGPFVPDWSRDNKYLVFQYQPYGLPTESSIIKYDIESKKRTVLVNSRGHHLYPTWSPSSHSILFIWNQNVKDQLFSMGPSGENIKQLSPSEGYTEWATWYKPE